MVKLKKVIVIGIMQTFKLRDLGMGYPGEFWKYSIIGELQLRVPTESVPFTTQIAGR